MATRTITGTLIDPTGDAWTSASIRFELLTTFATQSDSVVLQREETATTDGGGDFSITLQVPDADAWAYRCTLPDGNTFEFNLESGDATTLHDIMADANLSATVSASALSAALSDYAPAADLTAHIADTSDVHGGWTVAEFGSLMSYSIEQNAFGPTAVTLDANVLSLPSIPTSDPGVAGRVWNDSGTLKVSAG